MSETERLDLDAVEAMITEFCYSGVLRWPHAERVKLGLEIAKKAPALVARVRELEEVNAQHLRHLEELTAPLPGQELSRDAQGALQ